MFDCEHGHFPFAGRVLHDHEPYGDLSVEQIITKILQYRRGEKWASKWGEDRLYDYVSKFGFGAPHGIAFCRAK